MFDKFVNWLENIFAKDYIKYKISFGRMMSLGSDNTWKTISIFTHDCSYRPIVTLLFCDHYSTLYLDNKLVFGVEGFGDMINQDIMQDIIFKIEDITGQPISDLYSE